MCPLSLDDPRDFEELSDIVKGFSSDTRLALLLGFHQEHAANEIADFLEMTRGGLQNNIEKMINAELVYRPEEDDQPTYRLTPIGKEIAEFFQRRGSTFLEAIDRIGEAEEAVLEEVESQRDSMLGEALSERDIERLVHTQKWKRHGDSVQEDILDGTTPVSDTIEIEGTTYLTVVVTQDVEEEYGTDGRVYDLSKGDVVTLPEVNALALIEKGAAERLSESSEMIRKGEPDIGSSSSRKKITSKYLERIKKMEKESRSLLPLRDTFYEDVGDYVHSIKEDEVEPREELEFNGIQDKVDEIEKTERLVNEILELRMEKLTKDSLRDTDDDSLVVKNATAREQDFLEQFHEANGELRQIEFPESYRDLLFKRSISSE